MKQRVGRGPFNVDGLEFGSAVNYLSAAAIQKSRNDHSIRRVLREALVLGSENPRQGQIIALD